MRCRLFIDEVGNGDLRGSAESDNERYLSLTGLITRIDIYERRFKPEIAAFKDAVFGQGSSAKLVFHRREIVRREREFAVLRDPLLQTRFNTGLLNIIKHLPYLLTTVAIDKRQHLETYAVWHFDPYHYCLRAMIERYVLWMKRHDYTGDVVVEPRGKKPDRRVKVSFAGIFDNGTENIPAKIIQKHITSREVKFFPKSFNCPAMQLVDLLAHPSFRAMKFERNGDQIPDDFGAKVVEILEDWKYARHPVTHVRVGWGKKWLPK